MSLRLVYREAREIEAKRGGGERERIKGRGQVEQEAES